MGQTTHPANSAPRLAASLDEADEPARSPTHRIEETHEKAAEEQYSSTSTLGNEPDESDGSLKKPLQEAGLLPPTAGRGGLSRNNTLLIPIDEGLTKTAQVQKATYAGVAFCITQAAYGTGLAYTTSLYPTYGFYALAILNLMFAVGAFFALTLGAKLGGQHRAMAVFLWGYALYLLSLQSQQVVVLILCAGFTGICGGIIWINQGRWMQLLAAAGKGANPLESIGLLSGIFFALSNFNCTLGNAISVIVLKFAHVDVHMLLWYLFAITSFGCCLAWFISSAQPKKASPMGAVVATALADKEESHLIRLKKLVALRSHRPTKLFLPLCLAMGTSGAFTNATIPSLVKGDVKDVMFTISMGFIFYGLAATAGSFTFGKLFDSLGWKSNLLPHLLTSLISAGLVIAMLAMQGQSNEMAQLALVVQGLVDSCLNCIANVSVSRVYVGDMASSGWSMFRMTYAIGYAVYSLISPNVPDTIQVVIFAATQFIAAVCFYFFACENLSPASSSNENATGTTTTTDTVSGATHGARSRTTSALRQDGSPGARSRQRTTSNRPDGTQAAIIIHTQQPSLPATFNSSSGSSSSNENAPFSDDPTKPSGGPSGRRRDPSGDPSLRESLGDAESVRLGRRASIVKRLRSVSFVPSVAMPMTPSIGLLSEMVDIQEHVRLPTDLGGAPGHGDVIAVEVAPHLLQRMQTEATIPE